MTAAAAEPPALLLRPSAPVVGGVQLSLKDRAPQVQVSADGLSASSRKGYRSVRATHGAAAGAWYCEVLLESLGETGQARLGWCVLRRWSALRANSPRRVTSAANLNAPVGFDEHGYAFRCGGDRVHQGRREPYGCVCAEGDVVGLYLATGLAAGSVRRRSLTAAVGR
jgi:Set1/Ash2 histone methyltransferase complex subunit ASH2